MKHYISVILLAFSLFCVLLTPAISETFICNTEYGPDKSLKTYETLARQLTLEIDDKKISSATLIKTTYLGGKFYEEYKQTFDCDVKHIDTDTDIECWHDMIKEFPSYYDAKKSMPKNFAYRQLIIAPYGVKDDPLSSIKTGKSVWVRTGIIKAAHTRKGVKGGGHRTTLGTVICK